MRKIFTFIREAKVELTKVTWPTKDQLIRSTILVVVLTGVLAVFLGSLDYGFGYILKAFIVK
jgi:preprotein translocase subunit SecE